MAADDINKIQKQLQDLKKHLDSIDKDSLDRIVKAMKSGGAELAAWESLLDAFQTKADKVSDSLDYVSQSLADSVNEMKRLNNSTEEFSRKQRAAARNLASISDQILNIRKGNSSYDDKEIKKLKEKANLNLSILQTLKNTIPAGTEAYVNIMSQISSAKELLQTFNDIKKTNQKTTQSLGGMASIAKGLDKAFQKSGLGNLGIADAVDETKKLGQEAERLGDKGFKPMSTFVGLLKNKLGESLSITNLLQGSMVLLLGALKSIDDGAGKMAKSMNITYSEALKLRSELTGIANASGDNAVNTQGLQESLLAINDTIGARVSLNEKDLTTFTKMREQAGLTNEEIYGIQQLATLNNATLEETNEKLLGAARVYAGKNKLAINEKQILKDVSKASDALKLSLGGGVDKLAEAAIKARQFGLSLEQTENMAESLLNFESSIENELSAELLTGKNLNLEKARSLALSGDTAAAAAEMAKQMGSAAEFGKMNVIQQEALAKSVGMNRGELAKSLTDQVALQKMGAKEGQSAQERYNELRAQGLSQAEIQAKLGKDANADLYEQQSIQERFNQTVEKLKEIFITVGNALMPIFDIFSGIFDVVGPIVGMMGKLIGFMAPFVKYGLIALGIFKGIKFATDATYRTQLLSNAAAKIGLITDNQAVAASKAQSILSKGTLLTENQAALVKRNSLGTVIATNVQEKLGNVYKSIRNTLETTYQGIKSSILGVMNSQFLLNVKDFALEKGKFVLGKLQLGLELAVNTAKKIGNAITKGGLILDIGEAVMDAMSAVTSGIGKLLGPLAIPIALAAGAAVGAIGMSFLKGNDVFSPAQGGGGYGKRTLLAPEGAIQLNDRDNVIATTNPMKADDLLSTSKGAIQVSNKTAPKKEEKIQKVNTYVSLEMSGQKLGHAVHRDQYLIP
jgi:hypothetical protein